MSRCKPVFPPITSSPVPESSLPSSASSSNPPRINDIERIAQAYAKLEALPDELSPPSRPPSPLSQPRTDLLAEKIKEAVDRAGRNASNAKWTQVARTLRMACTSRLYRGVPHGVRVGEKREVGVEAGNYKWVLPDTAAEWGECEERWNNRISGLPADGREPSKPRVQDEAALEDAVVTKESKTPTKEDLVRDKVRAWQAKVIHAVKTADSEEVDGAAATRARTTRDHVVLRKKQSPITFPVAKSSAVASGGKIANGTSEPALGSKLPNVPTASDLPCAAQAAEECFPADLGPVQIPDLSEAVSNWL